MSQDENKASNAARPAPNGAPEEMSRLFEQHNRQLVSFLIGRLGNETEARDVAQEAYVRVLQLDQPGAVNFMRAYLYKTAANLATDRIRHRARVQRFDLAFDAEELQDTRGPDRQHSAREQLALLHQALLELPAAYRRAFLLHRFEDQSAERIGAQLGLGPTQAMLYVQRAHAYCRLRLDGMAAPAARTAALR